MGHESWYKLWTELNEAVTTGKPRSRKVFGLEWWDNLNANPKELEDYGEAMKSNSLNSLRGVLANCDFTNVKKIADIGGGFGHLAVALIEKYPRLEAAVLDVADLIPVARERLPIHDPAVAKRLEYVAGDMFESVPGTPAKLLDLLMLVSIPGRERTQAQWNHLYRESGLEIRSITPIHDNFGTSIVEGVKRRP